MPTYDYKCTKCDNIQEEFHGISEEKEILCNECQSVCEKTFSTNTQFILKGSGWPSKEQKLKSDMTKKNNKMKGISKDRENAGEAVRNVDELKTKVN